MPHTPTIVFDEDRARLRAGLDTQATQTAEPGEEYLHAAPDAEEAGEAPQIGGAIMLWGGLSSVHQALIESSAINVEVAHERGYRTVEDSDELTALGFTEEQARVPALLIPVHGVDGEVVVHQIRPDNPRIGKNGKPIKYERPKGSRMALDVPPTVRPHLSDPSVPLYITEGSRKADAAASKGLCCIGLLGTYGWRGTNAKGGKTALADFDSIALNGREVNIVFDSDVQDKKEVQADGSKVGLDDFFAAGNTVADLAKLVKVPKRERFTLLTSDEVLTLPDPEWLIEGVLPLGGQALLYGQPASYKSFVAPDKALHVASGLPWHPSHGQAAPGGLRGRRGRRGLQATPAGVAEAASRR